MPENKEVCHMKILNDNQAIKFIERVISCTYDNEKEGDNIICALNQYNSAIGDIIFYGDEKLSPEEILRLAREKNKPILL